MLKNIKRNSDQESNAPCYSRWKPNLKEISRGYLKIAGFTTALEQYSKTTLFIKAKIHLIFKIQMHTLIESLFPNSTITTIKDSGHLPHIQQKDVLF